MSNNSPAAIVKQKALMLLAIEANYGNITKAAKVVKITSQTHYRWLREDRQYAEKSEDIKDISFRKIKDNLLDVSMKMAEKGNAVVLNQLLRIYFKNIPQDMNIASRHNNVQTRVGIKWVNTPVDPTRTDHLIPKEERDKMLGRGSNYEL